MKCKYWKRCELYEEEGYTCNHEEDADGYCGKRREFEEKKKEIFEREKLLNRLNQVYDNTLK